MKDQRLCDKFSVVSRGLVSDFIVILGSYSLHNFHHILYRSSHTYIVYVVCPRVDTVHSVPKSRYST